MLIKVDKYIFPVDFVVLDVDEDVDVPLILGRPFLSTSEALIDMDGGELTLKVGDEKLTYRLAKAMRHSLDFDDTLYYLDTTDELIDKYVPEMMCPDAYEGLLDQDMENEDIMAIDLAEEVKPAHGVIKRMIRKIRRAMRRHKKSPNANGDEHSRSKGVSPLCGNKLNHFPSTLQKLCHACFQVVGKSLTLIHEPQ